MYLDKVIGGRHTAVANLKKGFPSHVRGEVDDEVKSLIRTGFILPKTTSYGLHVSINPHMIPEIERILETK
jgi:hypothetical protein